MDDTTQAIVYRSNQAQEYFVTQIKEGVPDYEARLNAINEELLAGLLFSPTDFIEEAIRDMANDEIDVATKVEIYLALEDKFAEVNENIYIDLEKENKLRTIIYD